MINSSPTHLLLAAILASVLFGKSPDIKAQAATTAYRLPSFHATYKANIKGFGITATRELKAINQRQYELSFTASSWAANIDERSVFEWGSQRITPLQYLFKQKALGKKKQHNVSFDSSKQIAISHDNGESTTLAFNQNTFDQLNYQLQLQWDLSRHKDQLAYKVISKGTVRDYRFEILGEEILETTLGSLNTTKVKVLRNNTEKVTYIWFANDWHFLLTQLEQYEGNKKKLSIQLTNASVDTINVKGL